MISNPDMVIGATSDKEAIKPNWYKVFVMAGTDSKLSQHECLYEGKAAYEKLYNRVIVAQLTVDRDRQRNKDKICIGDERYKDIEHTPSVSHTYVSHLQPREQLLLSNKIWRYLDLYKFEDFVRSRALYFTRLDQFSDNLEGMSPYTCIKAILNDKEKNEVQKKESFRLYKIRMENNRKVGFACCWHINNDLNFKMWNIYGQDSNQSICIETSVRRLNKVLVKSKLPFIEEPVQYFREPYFNQNAYWFPSLFKRAEFKHEQEYMSILFMHGFDLKGFKVKINPEELIRKIYVHPNASKEFFKQIREFVKANGLKIPIAKVRPKNRTAISV